MMPSLKIDEHIFTILIEEKRIQETVKRLGQQIADDYRGRKPILTGILNGSFLFIADLVRAIDIYEAEIDFLKIGSYGDHMLSSGTITLDKDVSADIRGRHVIVIEDIVDSGLSVTFIRNHLMAKEPASLEFASLLVKKQKAKIDFPIKYVGFEIGNEFVIGYGLDYKQQYRHLRDIYVTKS